jgi:hypothetical protein
MQAIWPFAKTKSSNHLFFAHFFTFFLSPGIAVSQLKKAAVFWPAGLAAGCLS